MSDIKDLLKTKARRPERTVFVCVAADLVDKHRLLNAELAEEMRKARNEGGGKKRLGETAKTAQLGEEIKALEAEMADATVEVKLRAVIPAEWREWRATNPPREGNTLDEQLGLDSDALIDDMTRRCIVEPKFDDEDWTTWRNEVAAAEQLVLAYEVYGLHERRVDVPKSQLASLVTTSSGADSKQRLGSE